MAPIKHPTSIPQSPPTLQSHQVSLGSTLDHTPPPTRSLLSKHLHPRVIVTVTSSSSSAPTSSSILAEAVATTHLSWWQLLALLIGSVLALWVGVWLWWRHRRKKRADNAKRQREAAEKQQRSIEGAKERELAERMEALQKASKGVRRGKREESESSSGEESWSGSESDSESDDSLSDGGTIRPSMTRRRRVHGRGGRGGIGRRRDRGRYGHSRRGRGRRREESEIDTEDSDETYYPRHHRRRERERDRRRYDYDTYYDHPPPRRPPSPQRRGSSPPPVPPLPAGMAKRRKRDTFRDSVFSSYNSMKKAAVRLKYVEAKVKLKKRLEEEAALEAKRMDKVREANMEIERSKRRERELREFKQDDERAGSAQVLIPPVIRRPPTNHSSSTGSSSLPTPPRRHPNPNRGTAYRGGSLDTIQRQHQQTVGNGAGPQRQLYPSKSATVDGAPHAPKRQATNDSLGDEISQLLGNGARGGQHNPPPGTKPPVHTKNVTPKPHAPVPARQGSNASQSPWRSNLSHPRHDDVAGFPSVPETARSDSVYLPVTHPRERPMIPKGGLAPAPPPKARKRPGAAGDGFESGGGAGGGAGVTGGVNWGGGGISGMLNVGLAAAGFTPPAPAPPPAANPPPGAPSHPPAANFRTGTTGRLGGQLNVAGVGAAGSKWANRLRERK